jgi:enolase
VPGQVYHALKSVIKKKYGQDACNVGDEGGFAPNIGSNREGAELLVEACKKSGHSDKVRQISRSDPRMQDKYMAELST